jgi:hypothetical protein
MRLHLSAMLITCILNAGACKAAEGLQNGAALSSFGLSDSNTCVLDNKPVAKSESVLPTSSPISHSSAPSSAHPARVDVYTFIH